MLLALAGCTIIPPANPGLSTPPRAAPAPRDVGPAPAVDGVPTVTDAALNYAALGQQVTVGGPRVTPLEVVEDSRCPMNARCVWAGQVRLKIRIELGSGTSETEITSGKPIPVADGQLELADVRPDKVAGQGSGSVDPGSYRFGFRFAGGL